MMAVSSDIQNWLERVWKERYWKSFVEEMFAGTSEAAPVTEDGFREVESTY